MSITKTKIRYNGREFSSPGELPPEVRMAYEKALHDPAARKFTYVNGQKFASEEAMPPDVRKLCDDVMSVIENNGEVTIPTAAEKPERLLSKREVGIAIGVGLGIAALVLSRIMHG